mmetsp:Transcript_38230/g.70589  ORF Transcript_38230/g.70589 Transcript_38230/m.70589 type:complete len:362 (+) Transcript_38230:148-1233(+)
MGRLLQNLGLRRIRGEAKNRPGPQTTERCPISAPRPISRPLGGTEAKPGAADGDRGGGHRGRVGRFGRDHLQRHLLQGGLHSHGPGRGGVVPKGRPTIRGEVPEKVRGSDGRVGHIREAPGERRDGRERLLRRRDPSPPRSVPRRPPPSLRGRQSRSHPVDYQLERIERGAHRRGIRQVRRRDRREDAGGRRGGDVRSRSDEPHHSHYRCHLRRRADGRAVRPGGDVRAGGGLPVLSGRRDDEAVHQVVVPDQERGGGAVRDGLRLLRGAGGPAGTRVHRPAQGPAEPGHHPRPRGRVDGRPQLRRDGGRRQGGLREPVQPEEEGRDLPRHQPRRRREGPALRGQGRGGRGAQADAHPLHV